LELHGALTPLRGLIFSNAEHSYAAIHGITTQCQHVTVLDALKLGSPMNFGAAGVRETERVSSGWVVVGAHVTPQSLYTQIEARIPGLPMWLEHTGGGRSMRPKTENSPAAVIYEFGGVPEEKYEIPALPGDPGLGDRPDV
jgi:hypothetical protein